MKFVKTIFVIAVMAAVFQSNAHADIDWKNHCVAYVAPESENDCDSYAIATGRVEAVCYSEVHVRHLVSGRLRTHYWKRTSDGMTLGALNVFVVPMLYEGAAHIVLRANANARLNEAREYLINNLMCKPEPIEEFPENYHEGESYTYETVTVENAK